MDLGVRHLWNITASYSDSLLSCFLLFSWYKRCMYSVELRRSSSPTSRISHISSSLLKYTIALYRPLLVLSSHHLSPSTSELSSINYHHQNLNTISTLSLISQRYIMVLSLTFSYISWLYSFDSSTLTFETSILEKLILFCVLKTSILLMSINIDIALKHSGLLVRP
jgi:hypothetical protein